jgi:serine/threonine protein kinase
VKKLFASKEQSVTDFSNEVNLISNVQHKNLVKLLGFSVAGTNRLLVYEYLPNKSLDHFLFGNLS